MLTLSLIVVSRLYFVFCLCYLGSFGYVGCLFLTGFYPMKILISIEIAYIYHILMTKLAAVIILAIQLVSLVRGSEIKSQVSLAVTVYNNQFAIVKDVRSISFDQGRSDLYFTDVSSNIQT